MCFFPPRVFPALALVAVFVASCGRSKPAATLQTDLSLDATLIPATLAANLRAAGGGHYRAVLRLRIDLAGKGKAEAGTKPASPPVVTTTTDLWVDKQGSFRLVEENDQDGGREIVRAGGEVAVALRYGKLMRRPVRDAESERFLAEALGAPWAAWELVRRQVAIEAVGQGGFRFKLGDRPTALPAGFPPAQGLRKWRDSTVVKSLEGQATLDVASRLPLLFACKAGFAATRDDLPIAGEIEVGATLADLGKVASIAMPDAGTLPIRQRTVLEERALLGGLSAASGKASP
jgi:hypothetical protein